MRTTKSQPRRLSTTGQEVPGGESTITRSIWGAAVRTARIRGGLCATPTFRRPWRNRMFPAEPVSSVPTTCSTSSMASTGHTSRQPPHE